MMLKSDGKLCLGQVVMGVWNKPLKAATELVVMFIVASSLTGSSCIVSLAD
jgi:hypothetical protein